MRQLFRTFDQDHSGSVSYEEFCHIVCPDLDEEMAHTMWNAVSGSNPNPYPNSNPKTQTLNQTLTPAPHLPTLIS